MQDDPFDTPPTEYDPDAGIQFDQYGRYKLPHPESGRLVSWTRATTFAKAAADTYLLNRWQERMAVKGLTIRRDLLALAGSTPLEDRKRLNEIVESAKEAAGAKSRANLGTALHGFTEIYDRGERDKAFALIPDELRADLVAYEKLIKRYSFEFIEIERRVIVPKYNVAGTFDRMGYKGLDGRPSIVDLKTGASLDFGMTEIAVQLALYANAPSIWDGPPYPGRYLAMPTDIDKQTAWVIHLPAGEGRAELHEVNIAVGWTFGAKLCADVRRWWKVKGLSRLVAEAEADDTEPVIEHKVGCAKWGDDRDTDSCTCDAIVPIPEADTFEAQIKRAGSRGDLSGVWRAAAAAGAWTPELAALGKARLAEIEPKQVGQ